MKRNWILVCIFVFLASLLFGTGCTCYTEDGDELRGCGHTCREFSSDQKGCGMACLDQLCPGEGIYEDYVDSISLFGEVGLDYEAPAVAYDFESNPGEYRFSLQVLRVYDGPWKLDAEICFLQNGHLIGQSTLSDRISETGEWSVTRSVSFNHFYDPNEGAVVAMINHVSLTSEG